MEPKLRVEGASKIYDGKSGPVHALEDISLDVAEGELVTILGPSGCGKTTLLWAISGLHALTGGRIILDGTEVDGPRPQQTGMIDIARCLREDDRIARSVTILDANPGEQVRHLVVLLLRPFLERMVVAPRACQALAQKGLGYILRQVDSVLMQDEVVERTILPCVSGAREDLAGKLIPRLVLLHAVVDPVVEGPHGCAA